MAMTIDRVCINHLARATQRERSLRLRLAEVTDWPLPRPLWYPAVDGLKLPAALNTHGPAYGNVCTIRRILEDGLADGIGSVLILENDVLFAPDFGSRLTALAADVPDGWDVVQLGGRVWTGGTPLTPRLSRGFSVSTYAVAFSRAGMEGMLLHLARHWHRDQRACLWLKHWVEAQQPAAYIATPPLVGHAAGQSMQSNAIHAQEIWE